MHTFPAVTSSAHTYSAMAETLVDVDELIGNALAAALEALEHSKPKMSHYPEPEKRHADAIRLVRLAIKESSR